jgi:single-stranded-DNA-specific exonuclease
MVLGDTEWKPALLGLAANSLMSGRGGAVCLWGRDGNGKLKGSCRSDGTLSVVELFSACEDHFEAFGGHHASGGFTLRNEYVHTLPEALARAAGAFQHEARVERAHDALITLREVSPALLRDIARLAPFGVGNEKPVFLVRGASAVAIKAFGKEKNHLEVTLACDEMNRPVRAFDFFRTAADFTCAPAAGVPASVLATIERDTFRGGIALRLVDIIAA